MQTKKKIELKYKDSLKFLAARINLTNAYNWNQFVCSIQFVLKNPRLMLKQ